MPLPPTFLTVSGNLELGSCSEVAANWGLLRVTQRLAEYSFHEGRQADKRQ